jgi:hypothetical protein
MPTYPSSLYMGVARSGNATTNDPGSYLFNNFINYLELKDTVVGLGVSIAGVGVLTANDFAGAGSSFFSAAKYPTDVRVGTTIVTNSTDLITDFNTVLVNFAAAGIAYTTAALNMTTTEKVVASGFAGISYNNLLRKIQHNTFELSRLAADIARVNAGTGFTTTVSRYPSSQNRFTNTVGGM